MFDPKKLSKQKEEKAEKKKTLNAIKEWCLLCIPVEMQHGMFAAIVENYIEQAVCQKNTA